MTWVIFLSRIIGSLMHGLTCMASQMQTINFVVRDQTGGEVHFKVKPHTKFTKVIEAYCNKKAVGADTIKSVVYDPRALLPFT